jgi:putative (di)nucleoside polyphosphate hydrolase
VPLDVVIEFKRDVYQRALHELSRFLASPIPSPIAHRHVARYLRQTHGPRMEDEAAPEMPETVMPESE